MFLAAFDFFFLERFEVGDLRLSFCLGLGVLAVLVFGFIVEVSLDCFSSRCVPLEWDADSGVLFVAWRFFPLLGFCSCSV